MNMYIGILQNLQGEGPNLYACDYRCFGHGVLIQRYYHLIISIKYDSLAEKAHAGKFKKAPYKLEWKLT